MRCRIYLLPGDGSGPEVITQAIPGCLAHRGGTPDLCGSPTTEQVTDKVLATLENIPERN
jgi:isocitrate/isopropylmalate dehydrogenase